MEGAAHKLGRRGKRRGSNRCRANARRGLAAARLVALSLLPLLSVACGYQFVRYQDALGDTRRVAILGIGNDTCEPGVDSLVTESLTREFHRRKALIVVSDPESADLVIGGDVDRLQTESLSFSSIQFALEYQVTMTVALEITRRDGTSILLDPNALQESELYLASADVEVARKNRKEALRRVASMLAGRVHDALFERMTP
jgi:hypothetical protein